MPDPKEPLLPSARTVNRRSGAVFSFVTRKFALYVVHGR